MKLVGNSIGRKAQSGVEQNPVDKSFLQDVEAVGVVFILHFKIISTTNPPTILSVLSYPEQNAKSNVRWGQRKLEIDL